MTEEHYNIIEYYENGSREQKKQAQDWLKKLNKVYDTDKNRVGGTKLYHLPGLWTRTNTHYILVLFMGYMKLPAFTAGPESRVPAIWIL